MTTRPEEAVIVEMDPAEYQLDTGYNFISDKESPVDIVLLQYTSPHDHLNCPVCQVPFTNPYTTLCGHTFCRTCIEESLKITGMRCPLDRTELDLDNAHDVYPSPVIIKNLLDELEVRCLNVKRGCNWEGPRWEIKKHLVTDCDYTKFECLSDPECGILTERRFLDDSTGCVHKVQKCDCGTEVQIFKMLDHLENECDLKTVPCNGCNLSFTKKEMEEHESCCSKQYIKCEAAKFGCDWKGTKLLFETVHERTCQFIKLSAYLTAQDSKITKLTTVNSSLQTQVSMILDSVIQGKVNNLGHGLLYDEVNAASQALDFSNFPENDENLRMFMEVEKLKLTLANLEVSTQDINNQNFVNGLVNENLRMKEELSFVKNSMSNIRQQLHFLMMERRRSVAPIYSNYSSDDENQSSSSLSGIKL